MDNEINTQNQINLESKIEALLFFKSEPLNIKKIADSLKEEESAIKESISKLKENLINRGLVLIENNEEFTLGTNPQMSSILEEIRKDEMTKDLTKSMLETLSIILYKNPVDTEDKNGVTRSEIDYIRGVNSSFILRNLLMRGLIEKTTDKKDARRYIYEPTLLLLQYMGVTNIKELPNYDTTVKKLNDTLLNQEKNQDE